MGLGQIGRRLAQLAGLIRFGGPWRRLLGRRASMLVIEAMSDEEADSLESGAKAVSQLGKAWHGQESGVYDDL